MSPPREPDPAEMTRTQAGSSTPPAKHPAGLADATRTAAPSVSQPAAADDPDATRTRPLSAAGAPAGFAPPSAPPGGSVGRFTLQSLHAKGGLGEVFTARDTELDRDVALKRIQVQYADDPASRRRFVAEAEITARLDHPGVVPVFGLVADPHGRPCYAMRFVRGETLKDEIERYHAAGGEAGPGKRVAFRQLLGRFVAVCQAIGYAHARGVIHRDIKPANVMVGTFGETLVVDWGLAKLVKGDGAAAEPAPPPGLQPVSADADATEFGTAVGTPAYMAPEQARGELDRVGPLADVYSLGATLYCLLTGKSPLAGLTAMEVMVRAYNGEVPPAREVNPAAPRPLEAVCLRAMAVNPDTRYPSAPALAADVERWLSDEPVSCFRDPPTARLARWARRHPARVAVVLSLLVSGLLATAVGFGAVSREQQRTAAALKLVQEEQDRTELALAAETAAKARAAQALAAETEAKADAVKARDVANTRYELAIGAFNTLVGSIQSRLADRAGTQDLRQDLLRNAQAGLAKLVAARDASTAGADDVLFNAHYQMGNVHRAVGDTAAARAEYATALGVADRQAAADPGSPPARINRGRALDRMAELALQAGDTGAALRAAREAVAVRAKLLAEEPDDTTRGRAVANARERLSQVLLERGETTAALDAGRLALADHRRLAVVEPAARRELGDTLERMAELHQRTGQTDAALATATEALAVRAAVLASDPANPDLQRGVAQAHNRLADVHFERAEVNAAVKAHSDARAVLQALVAADPRSAGARLDLANTLGRLGYVLARAGDAAGSLALARESAAALRALADADPGSAKARRDLAFGLQRFGDVQLEDGTSKDALASFRTALELLDALAAADDRNGQAGRDVALARARVGEALLTAGDAAGAAREFAASLALREAQRRADPGAVRAARELAISHDRRGDAELRLGRPAAALADAKESLKLFREASAANTGSRQLQRDVALALGKVGYATLQQGDARAALDLFRESLSAFEALAAADRGNAQARRDVAIGHERLSDAHQRLGDYPAALAEAELSLKERRALADANPASARARKDVMLGAMRAGAVQATAGDFAGAARWYREGLKEPASFERPDALAAEAAMLEREAAVVEAVVSTFEDPATAARLPDAARPRVLGVVIGLSLNRGDAARAARAADVLAANATGPADLYAAAAGTAAASTVVPAPADKERYAAQAVAYLRRAMTAGFRDADRVRVDRAWDAARGRDDFRAALAELEALTPLAPPPREK